MEDTTTTTKFNRTLQEGEIAILNFETQEVEIVEIQNLHEVEDVEGVLSEMGYDTNQIQYMTTMA